MKDSSGGDSHRILHSTGGPAVEVISYQAAFQPSCSPLNLSSRYMKWNLVGIVRRDEGVQDENLPEDDQTASITVEFHDSTFHHSMHLKDEHGWLLHWLAVFQQRSFNNIDVKNYDFLCRKAFTLHLSQKSQAVLKRCAIVGQYALFLPCLLFP